LAPPLVTRSWMLGPGSYGARQFDAPFGNIGLSAGPCSNEPNMAKSGPILLSLLRRGVGL